MYTYLERQHTFFACIENAAQILLCKASISFGLVRCKSFCTRMCVCECDTDSLITVRDWRHSHRQCLEFICLGRQRREKPRIYTKKVDEGKVSELINACDSRFSFRVCKWTQKIEETVIDGGDGEEIEEIELCVL